MFLTMPLNPFSIILFLLIVLVVIVLSWRFSTKFSKAWKQAMAELEEEDKKKGR